MADDTAKLGEGADRTGDTKKQNMGEPPAADTIAADDPHKVEKLANLGKSGADAGEATE